MPSIYVGTYSKYNSGSIAGAWLSLDDHDTEKEFYSAALSLHTDERDPELMFQDFESFPREFYGESGCDERLWQWLALDKHEREIVSAWIDQVGSTDSIQYILDCYAGSADSWSEYVENYVDERGVLNEMPDHLQMYFDYDAYGRDMRHSCTVADTNDGVWVFYNT